MLKFYCSISFLLLCWLFSANHVSLAQVDQPSEYRLKVAFLYNFAIYTEWPSLRHAAFHLCIHGEDPFGEHLQHLQQKKVNDRKILIQYTKGIEDLFDCQIVFITRSVSDDLENIINSLDGKPILTISDSSGSDRRGVALNMTVKEGKITFVANVTVAKKAGLNFKSQLLRFASEVYR